MTTTLRGRCETRFLSLLMIGVPLTFLLTRMFTFSSVLFVVLGYVLVVGWLWDILYHSLQRFRWDGDWPPVLHFATILLEGLGLWLLLNNLFVWRMMRLDGPIGISPGALELRPFLLHYFTVSVAAFMAIQLLFPVLMPQWRFSGGEWMQRTFSAWAKQMQHARNWLFGRFGKEIAAERK